MFAAIRRSLTFQRAACDEEDSLRARILPSDLRDAVRRSRLSTALADGKARVARAQGEVEAVRDCGLLRGDPAPVGRRERAGHRVSARRAREGETQSDARLASARRARLLA